MADREKVIKGLECCMSDKLCNSPCPYKGQCDDGGYYYSKAIEDAIELLEAQKPSVMTLDEVRAAEVVWLEQVGACVCAIKIQNFDSGIMSFAYAYNNYTSFVNIKPEYYGKISRCWTSRPTDAQMEAAAWNN